MTPDQIPTDKSLKRRLVTLPSWYLLALTLGASLPVTLPLAAIYDLVRNSRFSATRTLFFFAYFFNVECIGLLVAAWLWLRARLGMDRRAYEMANRRLQRWWARGLFWGTIKIFSMKITTDGLEKLEDTRPSVVLSRHASTLDTMLPLAIVRELKLFRYVIKAELLADPALDVVGQRFPNVFVRRGGKDPEFEVKKVVALGQDLEPNAAVVVYPEGTRFSAKKRARLLEKFADDPERLAIAQSLENTLPPTREGVVRLLEATPETDVVFIAHRGIDRAGAMSDLITGALTHAHLEIAIWRIPAAQVPRDEKGIEHFLIENWRRIDRFIREGSQAANVALRPGGREQAA